MYQIIILFLKCLTVFTVLLLIRGSLPRYRIVDLLTFWWKYIIIYCVSVFIFILVIYFIM